MKWAGGKRQLLPQLRNYYPPDFGRYVEPFFGSGAVFFDLVASGRLDGRRARLADANPDLVGCYRMLRDRTEDVITALRRLADEHRRDGEACYYAVRDERFNPRRAAAPGVYTPSLAAMLIYLNRTGFNGLFRLNRQGGFNVPMGRYVNPGICDPAHLREVARVLRARGTTFEHRAFDEVLADSGTGDFVYCDPPYAPLSSTARFAHYTADGFTTHDQTRLRHAIIGAARRGATVVLSNSSAPEILAGYGGREARAAGLTVQRVPARRSINARAERRGPVDEVIVSNAATTRLAGVRPRMVPARLAARRRTA